MTMDSNLVLVLIRSASILKAILLNSSLCLFILWNIFNCHIVDTFIELMSMLGKIRLKNECYKILTWSQRILALSERNV